MHCFTKMENDIVRLVMSSPLIGDVMNSGGTFHLSLLVKCLDDAIRNAKVEFMIASTLNLGEKKMRTKKVLDYLAFVRSRAIAKVTKVSELKASSSPWVPRVSELKASSSPWVPLRFRRPKMIRYHAVILLGVPAEISYQ